MKNTEKTTSSTRNYFYGLLKEKNSLIEQLNPMWEEIHKKYTAEEYAKQEQKFNQHERCDDLVYDALTLERDVRQLAKLIKETEKKLEIEDERFLTAFGGKLENRVTWTNFCETEIRAINTKSNREICSTSIQNTEWGLDESYVNGMVQGMSLACGAEYANVRVEAVVRTTNGMDTIVCYTNA